MSEQIRISSKAGNALYEAVLQLIGENGAVRGDAFSDRLPPSTKEAVAIFTEQPVKYAKLEQVAAISDGLAASEYEYFKELEQCLQRHGFSTEGFAHEYHHYFEAEAEIQRQRQAAREDEDELRVTEPAPSTASEHRSYRLHASKTESVLPPLPLSEENRALAERIGHEGSSTPRDSDEVLLRASLASTPEGISSAKRWGESLGQKSISPESIAASHDNSREIG